MSKNDDISERRYTSWFRFFVDAKVLVYEFLSPLIHTFFVRIVGGTTVRKIDAVDVIESFSKVNHSDNFTYHTFNVVK